MKCIYCRQEIRDDPQGLEGQEIDCEIDGYTMKAHVHDKCLGKLVGDFIDQRFKAEMRSKMPQGCERMTIWVHWDEYYDYECWGETQCCESWEEAAEI